MSDQIKLPRKLSEADAESDQVFLCGGELSLLQR
jgi:hypothetical protein